ncbi:TonB-dependent receptor [Lysobacter fragariae]
MTHSNRVRMSKLTLGLLAILATAPAFAQSTSAGLGGRVTGTDGQPVAGAEVTITHAESGTVSHAVTDADGRYNARGLRVGGPYTISIDKSGAGHSSQEGVYLNIDANQVDVALGADVTTLEAVKAVVGNGSDVFSADKMGAGMTVTREQLQNFGSIKRDLQDYARMDPRVAQTDKTRGELSVLGQNSRYNSITIDGVSVNDTFGIESNSLPTERQPISMDAIDEVQVNVTNYDVAQPRYSGANINAVTKSGTNDFHGSVYYIFRDKDMVGDLNGVDFAGWKDEKTYGATFGGPLLKDRLFFFTSYEKFTRTGPGSSNGPAGSGVAIEAPGISQAEINDIIDIARTNYGFDAGSLNPPSDAKNETEDKLVKFDWNINDNHRLSLRLNETEQSVAIFPNPTNSSRISLSSQAYTQVKSFKSQVAQLYSDWSDSFTTEFKVSHRDYDSRPVLNAVLPTMVVNVGGDGPDADNVNDGDGYVFLGTDQFRHANVLTTETWNYYGVGSWFVGDHTFKFGFDYESNEIYNLFVESSLGVFGFNSINDFRSGHYSSIPAVNVFSGFNLRTAAPGANPAAEFTLENLGLFVQDSWAVTPNLTLQYGIRADIPKVDEKPRYNQVASDFFGYRNDTTIDGNELIEPRVGFNYTFDSERRTQMRGGVGLFQGSAANVWLANPYTNNGQTIQVFSASSGDVTFGNGGYAVTLPPGTTPRQDLDILESGLKQPSVWKGNLAIDHELPWWGLVGSAEVVLTKVNDALAYQHLNLGAPTGIAPDGREIFWSNASTGSGSTRANRDSRFNDVLLTKQTNKGKGQNLTLSLTKPNNGGDWFWQLAYAFSEATEASPLTSSRGISNWRNQASFNPNEIVEERSSYVVKDRFTGAVNWSHAFFGDYKTNVGLFYEGRSGSPYSWTFKNDANGDGIVNDLLYIPAGPSDVIFRDIAGGLTGAQQAQIFWDAVGAHPELAGSRGTAVHRNDSFMKWRNNFDLRVSQEIPGFFKGNKAMVWMDVLNVGNLLNKEWGQSEEVLFDDGAGAFARNFVTYRGIDPATGKYIYEVTGSPEKYNLRDLPSRWAIQVGIKYSF